MQNNQKIIILAFLIISAVLIAGCVSSTTQAPVVTTTPTPIVTVAPIEVTPTPEPISPAVQIMHQECAPMKEHPTVMGVVTVLKNNRKTTVSGEMVLKVYTEAGVLLGTFRKLITIPPEADTSDGVWMYGVNMYQIYSMSTEYPGLLQTPPPRKQGGGWQCPGFRKA